MIDVLLSWSGGKDSLLALDRLRAAGTYNIRSLITSVARADDTTSAEARVPMHEVRRSLIERQASVLDLPVHIVEIPLRATNAEYEVAWLAALAELSKSLTTANPAPVIAFGDLFLHDVRSYRENLIQRAGWQAAFPLWGEETATLADEFVHRGFKAMTTSVERARLDQTFVGRVITREFLARLPANVDPCGENGEFHTFAFDGEHFREPVPFSRTAWRSTETHHICELESQS